MTTRYIVEFRETSRAAIVPPRSLDLFFKAIFGATRYGRSEAQKILRRRPIETPSYRFALVKNRLHEKSPNMDGA